MSANELRRAAKVLRNPYRCNTPVYEAALTDWLEWTYDQGHEGDMDDNGCSECEPALEVARLINGGVA